MRAFKIFIAGPVLAALLAAPCLAASATSAERAALQSAAHRDAAGRLQIDAHFDCTLAPPLAALSAAGLSATSTVQAGRLCVVEGWATAGALPQLEAVRGVTRISAPTYAPRRPPRGLAALHRELARAGVQKLGTSGIAIDQNGVSIMRADQFVMQTGTSGAGVTVGVQSNGGYSISTIQSRGELPASVQVLYPAGNTTPLLADEGTALLQEVYAVAPGANLAYCGPTTFVDFTSCLTQLIGAGATVVLDDLGFQSDALMSQDNDESSALVQILAMNPEVLMLTSAGNNDGSYWEGNYAPVAASTTTLPPLSCPANSGVPDAYVATFGAATSQTLSVTEFASFPLLLAWADPPGQLTSHFDVYWMAVGSTTPLGCFSSTSVTTNQMEQTVTLPAGAYTLVVASPDASAAGKFLKLWAGGDGLSGFSVATSGGLISPQTMTPGVLTVGAVNGSDGIGSAIEAFSSSGPLTVEFPAPAQLQAPSLVAPDGIAVDAQSTYFASFLFPDGNFYGTSASVPNAGAVAALLRGAFPALSVAQVTTALQSGATALGGTVPDAVFGYGRVDALGALATVPTPTISTLVDQTSTGSASTSPQPFSVTGTGALHFTVSSSNPALVPNSVVSAGTPGVTVSSGCGSSTLSCTLSVMPVAGQAGTAVLTVAAVDGANRPAMTQMTLTATDPAPPVSSGSSSGGTEGSSSGGSSSGGSSSGGSTASTSVGGAHGGGGGLQLWALFGLGALVAWSQRRAQRPRRVSL
jgi:hypothetical protein